MTVKEVIELLQQMPPETPVLVQQNCGGYEKCLGVALEGVIDYFDGNAPPSKAACFKVD